jgi:hypothetical protein
MRVRVHERFRAAVVADGIEPPLRVKTPAKVAVGEHDALTVVERPGEDFPLLGLDDRSPTPAEDLPSLGQRDREVVGERGGGNELGD